MHLMDITAPILMMRGLLVATTTRALPLVNTVVIGPGQPGVSWEAHLFCAIAGVAAAFLIQTHVHAPRLRGANLE
ncbi:hypothetical protein [Gemmobacter sp.]|uniref:hypothetical protein n=1 Tax=Gemmobacter sp. TaxID=1898957 RepID=UPI0025BD03FB|nr:hypothetical protein [Gemmobacter sp.]